jgi:hypothetical protein
VAWKVVSPVAEDRNDAYLDGGGSMLAVILSDWRRSGAEVTITVRGGTQVTGTLMPRDAASDPALVDLRAYRNEAGRRREIRHTVRMSEIAAVTAVAQ